MSTVDRGTPGPREGALPDPVRSTRRPAMQDVAKLAGVSHQTVSRVLNLHPNVRPETRTLVLAAMQQLGYSPNSAARALATGRSRTLGVITLAGTLYGPMSMLYGVEAAALEQGYMLTVASIRDGGPQSLTRAVDNLQRHRVEGIVVIAPLVSIGESLTALAGRMPLVAVEGSPNGELATVSVDQSSGARLATEHLLGNGHATVWHVAGPDGWYESRERVAGWSAALTAAGAEVPPTLQGDWSPASGYRAGQLLRRVQDLTAVFVANDQMALGVLRALNEKGLSVPGDVSLIGFDDIPEAGFFSPPLTTVNQPFDAVGRRSLEALLAQIDAQQPGGERVVIEPSLVVRDSVSTPRG